MKIPSPVVGLCSIMGEKGHTPIEEAGTHLPCDLPLVKAVGFQLRGSCLAQGFCEQVKAKLVPEKSC